MTTGIKFCGGCNPQYDRKACVEQLMARLPDPVKIAAPGVPYDAVYVICGCQVCCADVSAMNTHHLIYIADGGAARRDVCRKTPKEVPPSPTKAKT